MNAVDTVSRIMKVSVGVLFVLALVCGCLGVGLVVAGEEKPAGGETASVEEKKPRLDPAAGLAFIAAAIATGASSLGAGIAVSVVASAALGAVAERPELMGRSLIYVGLAEGVAIYGLVISILIMMKI